MGKARQERGGGDGTRTLRLQELIREEVNYLLRNEIRDPRLDGVEITMVELSGDGSRARLWFTCEGDEDRTAAFEHVAGFIRTHLADNLGLKRTPDLRFRRDPASRAFSAPAPVSPGRT
jgi:ribosome-binding factor A